ncbi:AAA family ATPase [Gordoniibacillus kamchatkensis]|uniref:AAA family ATPase n=1 Tax=Gordoniibacillus kamchatkensis TaxID=1590651 RepID=UPI0006979273|nr:AAA family ATPase [Paenibacillus sp. VKM B-2647]
MKEIKLLKLTLRNFKGIKEFVLSPDGGDISVYGDNAAGKTTLFDAFVWLLFNKDSMNRADFEIKTLDVAGQPVHFLNHEVEAVLMIDGRRKTLLKSYAEKWTKKRGSVTQEFSGHETTYYVDGVPFKKTEYDATVGAIVNENIFKLLTNPAFFNEQHKWQDRRKILLEVCGDVSDAEVIASNDALSALPDILGDRSIDDHRKVIAARRSKINDELEKIPIRIDEVSRSKPQPDGDRTEIQARIDALQQQITDKQDELARLQNGGEVAVKEKRLRELEGELLQLKNKLQAGTMQIIEAKRMDVARLRTDLETVKYERTKIANRISTNSETIEQKKDEASRLRKQWSEVNSEQIQYHHDENCPTCGQALPADQVAAAHENAQASFNLSKSQRLEQISLRGKAAMAEAKRLEEENESLSATLETATKHAADKEAELLAAQDELTALQAGMTVVESDPNYMAKQEEIATVRRDISALRSSAQGAIEEVRLALAGLRTELEKQQRAFAAFKQVEEADRRIAELAKQEKDLAAEYERLEQENFLTEEFIRTKVALLESKINSKFKLARFKLFEQQINGGVAECCETTYNGVPYSGGLNNGARINVGLDIINTLAEHYGVTAPIFVDNAESVTSLIETKGQQIRLIVPPKYDELPLEVREYLSTLYGDYEKALNAWKTKNKQLRVDYGTTTTIKEAV